MSLIHDDFRFFFNMVIVQFAELPEGNDEDNTKNKALQSYDDNDHVLPQ